MAIAVAIFAFALNLEESLVFVLTLVWDVGFQKTDQDKIACIGKVAIFLTMDQIGECSVTSQGNGMAIDVKTAASTKRN